MSGNDFMKRLKKALTVPWRSPPPEAGRRAAIKPQDDPVASPPKASPVRRVRPEDIRSADPGDEGSGAMISRSLPGIDVTLMVTPPRGDALWTLRGRLWLNPKRNITVGVALVQGENVLGQAEVEDGGGFTFQDVISGAWTLEFHMGGDRVVVLQGPAA